VSPGLARPTPGAGNPAAAGAGGGGQRDWAPIIIAVGVIVLLAIAMVGVIVWLRR
jgi:hypothetical protein